GSVEVNPALDVNYAPTNPLCSGMGCTVGLPPSPTYRAIASPASHTFPLASTGYSNASMAQIFTVANIGNQPLTNLSAILGGVNFEVSTPLSANSIPLLGTATIGIRPKNGLNIGSYTDTLTLRWDNDGGLGLAISLSFTVSDTITQPTLALTATPAASQTYPGNVILTATLSGAAPNNSSKPIVFTINGNTFTETTNALGQATHTVTSPPPGTYSFGASFAGDASNAPAMAAGIGGYNVTEDITPGQVYNIADFYATNGFLSVNKGDIIVVGEKRYRVLANTYTIEYWSQSSLAGAISWWTDYMDSFAAGGVVEEMPAIITVSGMILYQPSATSATITLFDNQDTFITSAKTDKTGAYTLIIPAMPQGASYKLVVKKPGYLSYTIKNNVFSPGQQLDTINISQLAGDINGDGVVNAEDLTILLSQFNKSPHEINNADIDGNGIVNAVDLTYLLAAFNKQDVEK
ncbi:MAG: carboxypeptidase regulatory-like domain-containing protein, partial [Clostridiales bacterium]|nr:carboxypeptidase regulatory-like domain-containing protein [Clostridiales bacterium]